MKKLTTFEDIRNEPSGVELTPRDQQDEWLFSAIDTGNVKQVSRMLLGIKTGDAPRDCLSKSSADLWIKDEMSSILSRAFCYAVRNGRFKVANLIYKDKRLEKNGLESTYENFFTRGHDEVLSKMQKELISAIQAHNFKEVSELLNNKYMTVGLLIKGLGYAVCHGIFDNITKAIYDRLDTRLLKSRYNSAYLSDFFVSGMMANQFGPRGGLKIVPHDELELLGSKPLTYKTVWSGVKKTRERILNAAQHNQKLR